MKKNRLFFYYAFLIFSLPVHVLTAQQSTGRSLFLFSGDSQFAQLEGSDNYQNTYSYDASFLHRFGRSLAGGMYLAMEHVSARQTFSQFQTVNYHIEPRLRYYLGEQRDQKFYLEAGIYLGQATVINPSFSSLADTELFVKGGSFAGGTALTFRRSILLNMAARYSYQKNENEFGNSIRRDVGLRIATGLVYHPDIRKYQIAPDENMLHFGALQFGGNIDLLLSPDVLNTLSYNLSVGLFLSPHLSAQLQSIGTHHQEPDLDQLALSQRETGLYLRRYFPFEDYLQFYTFLGYGRTNSTTTFLTANGHSIEEDINNFLRIGVGAGIFISRYSSLDISIAANFTNNTSRHRVFRVGVLHYLVR